MAGLLVINLLYEILLFAIVFYFENIISMKLSSFYGGASQEIITKLVVGCTAFDSISTIFSYAYGFSALYTHAVHRYNSFNIWLLISVLSKMITSYLYLGNAIVCILKLVLYIYSRFLLSVLYTVLVIPRDL